MQLEYILMHGAGNRIAIVDERSESRQPPAGESLARLADDGPLAGFDQLMWLTRASEPTALLRYRVFNADGSEVEQCGNGVRCVARLVMTESDDPASPVRLEGPAGSVTARMIEDGRIAVDMGRPRFEPASLPFVADTLAQSYSLDVGGQVYDVAALSMGNPHCVIAVTDVATAPVDTLGPAIENHERFPARTNVGFMAVRARDAIDLRVWERGVGETRACGTGACAAVVAARRQSLVGSDVQVNLPGGELVVSWRGAEDDPVWLAGDAERLSEGTLRL